MPMCSHRSFPVPPSGQILRQAEPHKLAAGFSKFNFDKEGDGDV